MNLSGYCCAAALALVVTGLEQQTARPREQVIDLTTASTISSAGAVPESRQLTLTGSPIVSSPSPETRTIRVLPPQLDRADYRIGEPFFFDVSVQNTGSEVIQFPTLLDAGSVDRQMAGAAVAAISLSFKDEVLGLQSVSPQFLYGARDVPGSLVSVPPQGLVKIRAQGRWLLSSATGTPKPDQWPRSLQIQAMVAISGNGIPSMGETSRETVPVVLSLSKR